ncbi:hypothetical protein [Streptomyces sp. NRRL S-350]|uniref:hypothetical protein n=1 Tax=Streptomyces sp. NRRL S-350 TaxID=1463902 RepID=UPI0004BEB58E|nr:hypothetical protein [Streptomyces sp. NRRL S-350]
MEQRGRVYERALEIAATDARAEVVDVVALALETLSGNGPDEVPLGRLLWHLDGGLHGRMRGGEGVDVLMGAVEAVSLTLAAERGALGRDDVVRITGGEYAGRAGLVDVPSWEPDHDARDVQPGLPRAYQVRLDGAVTVTVPAGDLRIATPTGDPEVFMDIAFPSVWFGCVVWGDRLVRWHAECRRREWEPLDLGPDPGDTVSKAALLVSAALLDAATTEGLDEPADGTALLDLPLLSVSALLNGTYDETIAAMLERTRPSFSATDQVLENLRELWSLRAKVEELRQRGRVRRLAHTIVWATTWQGSAGESIRSSTFQAGKLCYCGTAWTTSPPGSRSSAPSPGPRTSPRSPEEKPCRRGFAPARSGSAITR